MCAIVDEAFYMLPSCRFILVMDKVVGAYIEVRDDFATYVVYTWATTQFLGEAQNNGCQP
jgi:hypothetical protein